jgi:hypothetical protein
MSLAFRSLRIHPTVKRLTKRGWPSSFAVVQFPNPPLILALLASLAGHLTHAAGHRVALSIFYVALSVWAYEEAVHGENWFRRLLGVGFCLYIIVSLAEALHT